MMDAKISGASSVDLRQSKPENRIRNTAGDATHRSVMHGGAMQTDGVLAR